MYMMIEFLNFFLSLSETLHFSTTAEEMHISQPTLSKNMMTLEKELGVILFHRTTRNVSLTREGENLIPYAKKVVESYNDMNDYLQKYLDNKNSLINIISLPVMHLYDLSSLIMEYKRQNSDINLKIAEEDIKTIIKKIYEENADIAIVREFSMKYLKNFIIHHTIEDELSVICSRDHPLASQKNVDLSQLENESIILINKGVEEYKQALAPFGFENLLSDNVVATVSSTSALFQFVCLKFGISVLSKSLCKSITSEYDSNETIVIVPIHERPPFSIYIGTPFEHPSKEAKSLINFIKNKMKT
ncbi:LysR family transcriptional regulator [Alkalibaculum sporogenes]|nr:LysR family transcriptional regulator [Alkalibaculum sporogenes]